MNIKIYNAINVIDATDLDIFNNVLYSKGVYEFAESENIDKVYPKYFLGYHDGKIAAFAPAFIQEGPYTFDPFAYLKGNLRIRMGKLGLKTDRLLCAYTPLRPRSDIKILDTSTKSSLMLEMLNAIEKEAQNEGCHAVFFPAVPESNYALNNLLKKNGYIKAYYDAYFYMDIGYPTYEAFLKSLKKIRRDNLKYDATVLARNHIKIEEITDIDRFANEYALLHAALMKKYGHDKVELSEASFRAMYQHIQNTSSLVAKEDDAILGFTIGIYDKNCFHGLRCGQFHERAESKGVYFNLVYAESIKKAISLKCKRIDFGQSMARAKIMRGAKFERMHLYAKFFNPVTHNIMGVKIRRLGKGYYNTHLDEIRSNQGHPHG